VWPYGPLIRLTVTTPDTVQWKIMAPRPLPGSAMMTLPTSPGTGRVQVLSGAHWKLFTRTSPRISTSQPLPGPVASATSSWLTVVIKIRASASP
jgi:hypothetical protein